MDRFDAMSILLAVVEAGSLSAAARRLGTPLSTVSRKLSDLEKHLDTRLVVRSSRPLTLTEAGHAYVVACRRILDDLGEAERVAAGEYRAPRGSLVITAPIVFGRLHVLPIVIEFLDRYPAIDIRMVLADRLIHLLDDHIDLAVRIAELPDSSLVAVKLGAVRRVVCGSPGYFAAHGYPTSPEDLADHRCISFEGLTAAESWRFTTGRSDQSVPIHARLVVNTAEAAIDAAIAGVGVTRALSYQIERAQRAGLLEIVLEDFEPAPWPVSMVYSGQGLIPFKLRAFLDFAGPRLRAALRRNEI